jgi:hypothetical protein
MHVERNSLQPHDAVLRHGAHVIGKDVGMTSCSALATFAVSHCVRLSLRGYEHFLADRAATPGAVAGSEPL